MHAKHRHHRSYTNSITQKSSSTLVTYVWIVAKCLSNQLLSIKPIAQIGQILPSCVCQWSKLHSLQQKVLLYILTKIAETLVIESWLVTMLDQGVQSVDCEKPPPNPTSRVQLWAGKANLETNSNTHVCKYIHDQFAYTTSGEYTQNGCTSKAAEDWERHFRLVFLSDTAVGEKGLINAFIYIKTVRADMTLKEGPNKVLWPHNRALDALLFYDRRNSQSRTGIDLIQAHRRAAYWKAHNQDRQQTELFPPVQISNFWLSFIPYPHHRRRPVTTAFVGNIAETTGMHVNQEQTCTTPNSILNDLNLSVHGLWYFQSIS